MYKKDLLDLSEKSTFSLKKTLKVLETLLEILCFLKKHNYIHFDIKPDNVFEVDRDKYVLGDFGLCSSKEKIVYDPKGTPEYLAPEIIIDPAAFSDFSADMWSTAATVCGVYARLYIFHLQDKGGINSILHSQQKLLQSEYPDYLKESAKSNSLTHYLLKSDQLAFPYSLETLMEKYCLVQDSEKEAFNALLKLLRKMFSFNHFERITPEAALEELHSLNAIPTPGSQISSESEESDKGITPEVALEELHSLNAIPTPTGSQISSESEKSEEDGSIDLDLFFEIDSIDES